MTERDSAIVDHYLFGEMDANASEEFESRLMKDDEFYFAVVDRENDLVDKYAAKLMDPDMAVRFERSLAHFPARRQKLANARVIGTYIAEAAEARPAEEKAVPWYRRLGSAFGIPTLASSAAAILLLFAAVFLLVQNRNLDRTIAGLRNGENAETIEALRQREAELQAALEDERTAGGDLTSDLENERERRAELEAEIERLRKQVSNSSPSNDKPLVPTIATLVLKPVGIRGGPVSPRTLTLSETQKLISIKIFLDSQQEFVGPVSAKVNGESAATVRPRKEADGRQSIVFTLPAGKLALGINHITATTSSGDTVARYAVVRK